MKITVCITSLNVEGESEYTLTIQLADTDNTFTTCAPGKPEDAGWGVITNDNMQDTLTVVIEDPKTGAQVRSILGSFCELSQLDKNEDGIVDSNEYTRLDVGFITTAQTALIFITNLGDYGHMSSLIPPTMKVLEEQIKALPREATELLAGITAAQAKGELLSTSIDLIEGVDFYETLLTTLGINMAGEHGGVAKDNKVPTLFSIYNKLNENSGLTDLILANADKNISHIVKESISLIKTSEVDIKHYPNSQNAGGWVSVYPNSHLSPICMQEVFNDQVIGLGIVGQGIDEHGEYWVTITWTAQKQAKKYSVAWGKQDFTGIQQAADNMDVTENSITLTGLTKWQQYHIKVQSDNGSLSAPLTYKAGQIIIADTRVITGGGDSLRGRDVDNSCDPLTGLAINSDRDGILGARYLKMDNTGAALERQELSHKHLGFSCVADLNSGLIWETKKQVTDENPFSLHDDQSYFAHKPFTISEPVGPFNGSCYNPETDDFSSDAQVCNAVNQVKWVNESKLCGLTNWRLPSVTELYSIMDFRVENKINWDTRYFPLDSGLNYTYSNEWVDINGVKQHTSYFYGFWAAQHHTYHNETLATEGNPHPAGNYPLAKQVRPSIQLFARSKEIWQPNSVMLVSDGFKATTQVNAGSAQ